jgi:TRAP-type C4-dicarboxylate transport system permease small subunit
MLQTIGKCLDRALSFCACLFVAAFCAVVIIQILCRSLPFLPITSWTEELARYCFIYAVALGAGLAVRTNSYVAVDILTNLIPQRLRRLYMVCLNALLCAFAVFFETQCVFRFAFLKARMVSTAMEIPMQIVYFALVILFGMLALTYFLETLGLLCGGDVKQGVPQ